MKEKNWIKMKIGVWSVVKSKVGDIEETIREGRSRRVRKEVVVFFQDLFVNKRFLVLSEDR